MLRYVRVLAVLLLTGALSGCQGEVAGPEAPPTPRSEEPAASVQGSQLQSSSGAPACPDGFAQRSALLDPSVDLNGDGVICEKRAGGRVIRIDNPG